MAVVIDASTPAAAVSQTAVASLTTAAFTPPAGATLLMVAIFDTSTNTRTGTPSTVTGTTSAWTTVANYNNGNGTNGGLVHVSWAQVTSSVSTTVRVTWPASNDCALKVWVLTGTPASGSPIGVSGSVTLTTNPQTVSYTATDIGSQGFLGLEDFLGSGAKAITNTTTEATLGTNSNGLIVRDSAVSGSVGQTRTFSVSGTPSNSEVAWVEVIPTAAAAQTVTPTAIATGEAFGAPVVAVAGADQTVLPPAIATGEAFGSPTVTGGGSGPLTDRTSVAYTNAAGTSSVGHIYAGGLNWSQSVGLLVYTDGSAEFGLNNLASTYLMAGTNGLIAVAKAQNMILVTPLAPGAGCDDGGGTCWYDASGATTIAAKVKWADDFIQSQVLPQYPIDLTRVCIAGYSSGAQFTMEYYGPQYAPAWMQDGLLLAISYGGSPKVTSTYTAGFKANVAASWDVGSADPAYQSAGIYGVQAGYDWYTANGFATTKLTVVAGEDHARDGLFGAIVNREITQYVLTANVDQTILPTGIGTGEAFGGPLVTLNSGTFGVTLFPAGREGFLDGTVSWSTGVIKAALVSGYAVSTAHTVVSDVTGAGGTLVSTAPAAGFTAKSVAGGIADAEDVVFPAVTGSMITVLILFQSSAVTGGADVAQSAQRLIGYVDSPPGLPVIPTGADIAVTWSNDRTRIFML